MIATNLQKAQGARGWTLDTLLPSRPPAHCISSWYLGTKGKEVPEETRGHGGQLSGASKRRAGVGQGESGRGLRGPCIQGSEGSRTRRSTKILVWGPQASIYPKDHRSSETENAKDRIQMWVWGSSQRCEGIWGWCEGQCQPEAAGNNTRPQNEVMGRGSDVLGPRYTPSWLSWDPPQSDRLGFTSPIFHKPAVTLAP